MAQAEDVQPSKTPYQLDLPQTLKASKTLLKVIADQRSEQASTSKPNLLAADDDDSADEDASDLNDIPVWLVITTKKHIVDKKRLKPGKIQLPHSLNLSPVTTICLITADPQRAYKDAIESPAFPVELRSRIGRVIGLEKLKAKYKSFESKRQLLAEYDIFLADDRVVTYLPGILGKTFYKGGAKRPIPINLAGQPERDTDGKKVKRSAEEKARVRGKGPGLGAASPAAIAKEIEKSLSAAVVMLSPGTSTSVKVGRLAFTSEQVRDNIQAVVDGMAAKYITKGWRNVRAISIKGPSTMALPIWETDQLWVDDEDVLEEKPVFGKKKTVEPKEKLLTGPAGDEVATQNKRKADDAGAPSEEKTSKKKKRKSDTDPSLVLQLAAKKDKLKKQKAQVMAEVDGSII